jgi:hypothetical protein
MDNAVMVTPVPRINQTVNSFNRAAVTTNPNIFYPSGNPASALGRLTGAPEPPTVFSSNPLIADMQRRHYLQMQAIFTASQRRPASATTSNTPSLNESQAIAKAKQVLKSQRGLNTLSSKQENILKLTIQESLKVGIDPVKAALQVYAESSLGDCKPNGIAHGPFQFTPSFLKDIKTHSGGVIQSCTLEQAKDPVYAAKVYAAVMKNYADKAKTKFNSTDENYVWFRAMQNYHDGNTNKNTVGPNMSTYALNVLGAQEWARIKSRYGIRRVG